MEVSSLLDAYTIAYGWSVYKIFFLFLVAIGAPLYPVVVLLIDLTGGYTERGGDPVQIVRAALFRYVIWFVVLIAGLIPSVPLDMETAKIRDACGVTTIAQNQNVEQQKFVFNTVKVPVAPWVAMQLASGFRSVVSQQLPCVTDLTATNQALRTLDLSKAKDPAKLNAEQQRFNGECFAPSVQHYRRTIKGTYGQAAADRMRGLTGDYVLPGKTSQGTILSLPSSTFLRDFFYQKPLFCQGLVDTDTMFYFCLGLPIKAQGPVDQIVGEETSLLSEYQKAINETIPTCFEWFDTPETGLRDRLFEAAEAKILDSGAYVMSNPKQLGLSGLTPTSAASSLASATSDFIVNAFGGGDETFRNFMVDRMYTNQAQSGQMLSEDHRGIINTVAGVGALGTVIGVFGFDIAESIGQDAVSFYTSAMVFKVASSLLLPMLIMALFMFWAFYLVIAEMRGKALMQGLIMIFVMSIVPAIWAVSNQLDDQLYVAMFPQTSTLADILSEPSDHIERLLLDIVSTFFYTVLPLLLMYVVIAAGGEKQTAQAYRDTTSNPSSSGGSSGGRMARTVTGRGSSSVKNKVKTLSKS